MVRGRERSWWSHGEGRDCQLLCLGEVVRGKSRCCGWRELPQLGLLEAIDDRENDIRWT